MIALAITAAIVVAYSLFQRRLSKTILSGPLIFVAFGLIASPEGLGLFTLDLDAELVQILLKATLVVLLFTEASELPTRNIIREASLPGRLLFIAMPVVIALGGALALWLLTGVDLFWQAALLGAILAPTDAALGQPVVSNPRVPGPIRRSLTVEAGLNDGLAVPFAYLFAALAEIFHGEEGGPTFLEFLFDQIVLGIAIGIAVGWLGAKAANAARRNGWTSASWLQVGFLGIAVVSFALAEGVDGNGFIAAWIAGFVFRNTKEEDLHAAGFAEESGHVLTLLSFFVFGAILLPPALDAINGWFIVYALASLLLVRPIAVWISMFRAGLRLPTIAYLGWFGPRGIASLVLAVLVAKKFDVPGIETILEVMTVTVALSVLLHGVTAWPGSNAYANWIDRNGSEPLDRFRPNETNEF